MDPESQNLGKLNALTDCGQDCVEPKWQEPVEFETSIGPPTVNGEGTIYLGVTGDVDATPPIPGQVMALHDAGTGGEKLWRVEANGEIWQGNPVIGPNETLYFADAVCIHDPETGTDCDEDTEIPSLYAITEAGSRVHLPLVVRH